MAYNRTGTSVRTNIYNPRSLFTQKVSCIHNIVRLTNGDLFALLQVKPYSLQLIKSSDDGFTWDVQDDYWDSTAHYPRTKEARGINGPCSALMVSEKENWIFSFHIREVGSNFVPYYGSVSLDDPTGGGPVSTGIAWSSSNMNGIISACHNTNTIYILYCYSNNLSMRRFSPRTSATSGSVTETTNTWGDVFDSCCDDNGNVYCVGVDTSSTETLEFVIYNEGVNDFYTPVTIDTAAGANYHFTDIVIERDGYGNLCVVYGEVDKYPSSTTISWNYALSTNNGSTWSVVNPSNVSGYSSYRDAITAECSIRSDVIAGNDGGFLITYTQNRDAGSNTTLVQSVSCGADSGSNLNNTYWWLFDGTTSYYIWYNVGGTGTDPTPSAPDFGHTTTSGVVVAITSNDTAATVATATKTAINALSSFTATVSDNVVTITNVSSGPMKIAVDGSSLRTTNSFEWGVKTLGKMTPRSFVRHLSTSDGSSYTLGEQKDITNTTSTWNIAGAKFFKPAEGRLINLATPGLTRCAYQIGEGDDPLQDSSIPVTVDQDLLSVSAYPSTYPSQSGSYTVETAGTGELLVDLNIIDSTSSNIDFYSEGFTGSYTSQYEEAFEKEGTSVRILKYEPTEDAQMGDRTAFEEPVEYWVNVFLDPLSYSSPQRVEDPANTTGYVEQDIRKVYLPPDMHLSREFILNEGNFLKRTVWVMVFDGNEYELTQVVPRLIKNQITHYDCNGYVIGPSYNPFTREVLPSET